MAGDDTIRFSLYGTLGLTHDDNPNWIPVRDLSQRPRGQSSDSRVMDSRLGAQINVRLNDSVDLMVQAVLRKQVDSSPNSALDWAFVNLHPMSTVDVRLGRVGYDVFLMSDHRNLGYVYPWVRPPIEFYGWVPMYSVNGGDIAYSLEEGSVHWRFKAQGGMAGLKFPMGKNGPDYYFRSSDVWSLTTERESGAWRTKLGYSQILIGPDAPILEPLQAGLQQVAGAGIPGVSGESSALLTQLTYKGVKLRYANFGVAYDDGLWQGQAELGRVNTSADMVSNGTMAYVGVGRRFGDFTPFVLLSGIQSNNPVKQPVANWAPFGLSGLQATALSALNSTRFHQETASIGLRWDFSSHAALKAQWDSTHVHANGYGLWYQAAGAAVQNDAQVNLFSVTVDFIF